MSGSSAGEILEALCAAAVDCGASDLLLHEQRIPRVRVGGQLLPLDTAPLEPDFFDEVERRAGIAAGTKDADAALVSAAGQRFRVNVLSSLGRRGAVLRRVLGEVPALDSLGVPADVLRGWAASRSGMILVGGPTGSGKSTTVAALLEDINHRDERHVVTIEDPIEYTFADKRCLFTQREVGIDTSSFAEGLRRSLRQNPDVIFLGEIRDRESATTALQAAETGHLLIATVHVATAAEAIERVEGLFPADEREGVRKTLAAQLLGVLCQKLLPAVGGGLVVVCEHFSSIGILRRLIAENRHTELEDVVGAGSSPESSGFLSALATLVRSGRLDEQVAAEASSNPQELQRALRGIMSSSAGVRR